MFPTNLFTVVLYQAPPVLPAENRDARTEAPTGFPEYACPYDFVEHPRLSKINVAPVLPAGIRMGNNILPARFEKRDQDRLQLGRTAYPNPVGKHLKLVKRANANDMFVVTGPLPCLKGVKMSYMNSVSTLTSFIAAFISLCSRRSAGGVGSAQP